MVHVQLLQVMHHTQQVHSAEAEDYKNRAADIADGGYQTTIHTNPSLAS